MPRNGHRQRAETCRDKGVFSLIVLSADQKPWPVTRAGFFNSHPEPAFAVGANDVQYCPNKDKAVHSCVKRVPVAQIMVDFAG